MSVSFAPTNRVIDINTELVFFSANCVQFEIPVQEISFEIAVILATANASTVILLNKKPAVGIFHRYMYAKVFERSKKQQNYFITPKI